MKVGLQWLPIALAACAAGCGIPPTADNASEESEAAVGSAPSYESAPGQMEASNEAAASPSPARPDPGEWDEGEDIEGNASDPK